MTDMSPIGAAIAAAEILSEDGSPVDSDVSRILHGAAKPGFTGAGETRVEGVEETTGDDGEGPRDARDLGYDVDVMNRRHALVLIGSKSVVMDENPTAPIEERHTFRTVEAFGVFRRGILTPVRG